ncbi:MAG: ECF transporter S component [Firmicutes bacterium]|nr:ECF transporter S component [Bacillota bacterium]
MSKSSNLRLLVLIALFIALVAVATMVINVPMVATQGFINVGDTVIFLSALLMGPRVGALAGGLGSALADLLLGYTHWAPWTLLIKALEGYIAAVLGYRLYRQSKKISARVIGALIVSALWMVLGYYIVGGLMVGFKTALASVPGNLIQGLGSVILALPLLHAFRNMRL